MHELSDRQGRAAICERLSNLKSVKISAMNDILTRPNGAGLAGGGSTMGA